MQPLIEASAFGFRSFGVLTKPKLANGKRAKLLEAVRVYRGTRGSIKNGDDEEEQGEEDEDAEEADEENDGDDDDNNEMNTRLD